MTELAWRFHDMVDHYDGWTVFYGIQGQTNQIYLDLNLSLIKIGEEAHIPLEDFSVEAGPRRRLRRLQHKIQRKGCFFKRDNGLPFR